MAKDYNSAKSNTSTSVKSGEGGGKALEEFETDRTKGETSLGDIEITREAGEASPGGDYNSTRPPETSIEVGGDGKQPAREAGVGRRGGFRMRDEVGRPAVKSGGGGGSGSGLVKRTVGKTLGMAKTVIMTAVLISVAGVGVDVYQTYNDAIEIDLEKHITDADFELSEDKSEISGSVGFDIPEMGMFEKSIIASVHVTVLESNPTTNGDYEFEYTLGSGEQFYDFTLDDLDPVTVETIEAGEPLDIEYSGTISVTYLGVEIPSVTMDIPLTTTTVETA